MRLSSRTIHLKETLIHLNMPMAYQATELVIDKMCSEKGFSRHNGAHYYHHLVDVTQKLINFGIGGFYAHPSILADLNQFTEWKESIALRDEDILTASLLHDFVEDVEGYDINWIEQHYNLSVATMVDKVTKKKEVDYSQDHNKRLYLAANAEHIGAALIKTCDRIHNFSTLENAPIEKRYRQALETEKYFFDFFKQCRDTFPYYSYVFFEAKTQIEAYLWSIKETYQLHMALLQQQEQMQAEIDRLQQKLLLSNPNTPT